VIDAPDARRREDRREDALGDEAVFHDVGHAGRSAQVVLEDAKDAVGVADQVDAGGVDADASRGLDASELREIVLRAENDFGGKAWRREDALFAVDVVEKLVKRPHALLEPRLDPLPVGGRHHARHEAEGKDLLGSAVVAVHRKRHPLREERALGESLSTREFVRSHGHQRSQGVTKPRAGDPGGREELVPGAWQGRVRIEERGHRSRRRDGGLSHHDAPSSSSGSGSGIGWSIAKRRRSKV
jgi:hypothetical protein